MVGADNSRFQRFVNGNQWLAVPLELGVDPLTVKCLKLFF